MNIDGIPVRIMILKADGTSQDASAGTDPNNTSAKWLGFAKTLAWNCLQRSKKSHSWVSETKKLPSDGSTTTAEPGTLSFVFVKCHADQQLCLIIVRDSESTQHGIIVTPCSPLSPQGFGYPYTGVGVSGWGTPGFDGASNLDLTGYEGPSGGTAWQALMTDGITVKHPALEPHLVYGPDWGKIVGTGRSVDATFSDVRYGGAIAAPGVLASTLTKASVFSVKGSRGGWMIQGEAVGHIVDIDTNRQAGQLQYTAGNVPGVGSSVTYSTVEPSKIYKNGKPVNATLHDESTPVTSGGVPTTFADGRFIGVGVKVVGGSKRLLAIAALPDIHGVFVGDCGLFYADSPYKRLRFVQEFHVECNVGGTRQVPYFIFNESGTRASAIAYRQWAREGIAADGSELISQTVETDVVHVDIGEDGTSCTVVVEESEGCPFRRDATSDYSSSATNQYGGPSTSTVGQLTTGIGPYVATIAIGYDGDVEKRLTMDYSETLSTASTFNNIRQFCERAVSEDGLGYQGPLWVSTDLTNTFVRDDSLSLTYRINNTGVAELSYQKALGTSTSGTRSTVKSQWNVAYGPYSTSGPTADSFVQSVLVPGYRGWGPHTWDQDGWNMYVEMETSDWAKARFSRGGKTRTPEGNYFGWYDFYEAQFNRYDYILDIDSTVSERSLFLAENFWVLQAVDLINDKLYYVVLETTDANGLVGTSFKIMCNDQTLYQE